MPFYIAIIHKVFLKECKIPKFADEAAYFYF